MIKSTHPALAKLRAAIKRDGYKATAYITFYDHEIHMERTGTFKVFAVDDDELHTKEYSGCEHCIALEDITEVIVG